MKIPADSMAIDALNEAVENYSIIKDNIDKIDLLLENYEFPSEVLKDCLTYANQMESIKLSNKLEVALGK